jgi:serine/threonine-protein kinase
VPIDRYCDSNDISLEARLDLFRGVCKAVQVVHQHSTIHRDIKPENILVATDGQVKLVDFGIARVLEAADDQVEFTAVGLAFMTPMYASPEQIRGEILTTATDVYSLGAVLYKILTGRAPFTHESRNALELAVTGTRPTRPSETVLQVDAPSGPSPAAHRLSNKLKGDLDTITLMALRKEPERRYASVERFSEDIRCLLAGRPVSAQPDTLHYRAKKYIRRNTAAVATAALLILVLIGATVVSLTLYDRAETARLEAVEERTVASRERNAAVSTTEFLQGLLSSVSPGEIDGRLDITVREILDQASRRLDSELSDQPEVAAALHFVVGRSYGNLAEYESAQHHLEESVALRLELAPPDQPGILRSRVAIGQLYEEQGAYARAESLLVASMPDDPATSDPAAMSELESSLSRVYSYLARAEDAERLAQRSVESADRIDDPKHVMHAQSRSELGNSLFRQGRYKEAEGIYREAVATAEATIGPRHIVTGQCFNNLAIGLGALGRNDEAIEELLKALTIYEVSYPPNHPEFATTHMNLADQYAATEQFDTALSYYQLARSELIVAHGEDHVMVGVAINGVAYCYWKSNQLGAARESFTDAIRHLDASLGDSHPWIAVVRSNLATVYRDLGERDEAGRLAHEALSVMRSSLPENHPHLARPLGLLAELDMDAGDYQSALVYAREADGICALNLDEGHADRLRAEERLAECLHESSE